MHGKPNILWICTDQQRYDTIACLGNEHIKTPNIDKLCRQGVAFTHAHCQNPICSPSRASFLTGLYPSITGVNRNGLPRMPENPRVQLITKRLADEGYHCGLIGKLHLASASRGVEERTDDGYTTWHYSHSPHQGTPEDNEYHRWLMDKGVDLHDVFQRNPDGGHGQYQRDLDPDLHQTTWCAQKAIEFIEQEHDKPWLLSVNIFDPHGPFDAPSVYEDRYDQKSLPSPLFGDHDLEQQARLQGAFFQTKAQKPGQTEQRNKASYYGMITLIDDQVGRIMQALDDSGQRENTIVIYMSDHGEMLGDHGLTAKGCRFYEGLIRVPLIISWQGHFLQGVVIDALVELTDITPTLVQITGIPSVWTHGRSLMDQLTGKVPSVLHRDFVRAEYFDTLTPFRPARPGMSGKNAPIWASMLRDQQYKLVVYHNINEGELYDLRHDPDEINNLWDDPYYTDVKLRMVTQSYAHAVCDMDMGEAVVGGY
jgi:arylsulfatase A-like enzyme